MDEKTLDRVEKRAYELIDKYHACAQCSLFAIQEVCGMRDDTLTKAACGLSGGVGGLRSACGALTGASLALGIKYGRDVSMLSGPAEAAVEKELEALQPVAKLGKWFEREFGSISCGDIRRKHMGTELNNSVLWQKEWLKDLGMSEYCAKIVAKTARRATAMIDNPDLGILEEA